MMSPGVRKASLVVHVGCSVGWFGALAAYLALDIAALVIQDAAIVRGVHAAMSVIVYYVIVPLALGALVTGIVQALGTSWGLFRHYWVVAKLLLTVLSTVVLLMTAQTALVALTDPTAPTADLLAERGTLLHSGGGLIVLFVIMVLSVVKPRRLTSYGRRKQQEHRRNKVAAATPS
jgi:hypothetical protein